MPHWPTQPLHINHLELIAPPKGQGRVVITTAFSCCSTVVSSMHSAAPKTLHVSTDEEDLSTPLVLVSPTTPHTTVPVARQTGSTKKQPVLGSCSFAPRLMPTAKDSTGVYAGCLNRPRLFTNWAAPLACVAWLLVSSSAILVNKHILVDLDFPFPCTVAALGVTGTSIISNVAVRVLRISNTPLKAGPGSSTADAAAETQRLSWRYYCTYIAPAGLLLALGLHMGNTAYLYLSVAYIQMLKAFTPVVTMLFAFAFGLERPTLLLSSAVCLIAGGVAVASLGEGAFSMTGLAAMLASSTCEALRLVLMQAIMARRSMHPLQTLAHVYPAAWVWMVALAGATEALSIWQRQAWVDILQHPGALLASTAAGFGANAAAILVVSLTGALTLKCLGLAKDVGLVVYGATRLGEAVSALQACGFSVSLLGFVLYNAAKSWAAQHAASSQGYKKLADGPGSRSSSNGGLYSSRPLPAAAPWSQGGAPGRAAVGGGSSAVLPAAAGANGSSSHTPPVTAGSPVYHVPASQACAVDPNTTATAAPAGGGATQLLPSFLLPHGLPQTAPAAPPARAQVAVA